MGDLVRYYEHYDRGRLRAMQYVRLMLHRELRVLEDELSRWQSGSCRRDETRGKIDEVKALIVQFGGRP